jgi:hypothetical protein
MSVRECKFCGCSEHGACAIPIRVDDDDNCWLEFGAIAQLDPDIEYLPCGWLLEDVCTNPVCIEKAYLESRELAIAVQGLLDQGLVVISDDGEERLLLTTEGQFEAGRLRRTA